MKNSIKQHIRVTVLSAISLFSNTAFATKLVELADQQLSEVVGQDGVYLNLKNFSLSPSDTGPLTLTYTMPNPQDVLLRDLNKPVDLIKYSNIFISRTDDSDVFSDPYQLQLETLPVPAQVRLPSELDPGNLLVMLPDALQVIRLRNPRNLEGLQAWQFQYDWAVTTSNLRADPSSGLTHEMGTSVFENVRFFGGGIDLTPAWSYANIQDVTGTAFGLHLNVQAEAVYLRPRGASDTGVSRSELALSDIKISRALYPDGGPLGTTNVVDPNLAHNWTIADAIVQPGVLTVNTDSQGNSTLQLGVQWYRGSESDPPRPEAIGAISIGNVSIRNNNNITDFGAMSIGAIKLNYLNINFRN